MTERSDGINKQSKMTNTAPQNMDNKSSLASRIDRSVRPEEKLSKESEYVIHEDVKVGEQNLKMSSETHKSPDDIIKEAKDIYSKVLAAGLPIQDAAGKDALFAKLTGEHRDFVKALPIPFQRMVYLDEFSPKVLRRFLKANKQLFWKTEEDWLNAMAGYIVDLFKERNKHASETNVRMYRQSVYKSLKQDSDAFKENYEAAKKEVDELEKQRRVDQIKKVQEGLLERQRQIDQMKKVKE